MRQVNWALIHNEISYHDTTNTVNNKMRFNLGFCPITWVNIFFYTELTTDCVLVHHVTIETIFYLNCLVWLLESLLPACLASRLVTKFWLIKRWSFSNLSDDRNSCLLLCSFLSSCLCLQEVPQHFSILFSLLMIRGMHTECLKKTKSVARRFSWKNSSMTRDCKPI